MFTEIYIEALLVDDVLADQVWEAWDAGVISGPVAAWAWWSINRTKDSRRKKWSTLNGFQSNTT